MEQGDVLRLTSLPLHRSWAALGRTATVCRQSCNYVPRAEGLGGCWAPPD